jgi:hypothetical protein
VVFEILREAIRKPREPAHRHAHGEVLAFHMGRADVLPIRVRFSAPRQTAGL